MSVKLLSIFDVTLMSHQEINELMLSYRDQWKTSSACVAIIENCEVIERVHGDVGLVKTTKMEAGMRGRTLLTLGM